MSFQIQITDKAQSDINAAADYIAFSLRNPVASDAMLDAVEQEVNSLAEFPERYSLAADDVLSSWGIRFVRVKNYLAFYRVDTEAQVITVVRFLYRKSNWASILHCDLRSIKTDLPTSAL